MSSGYRAASRTSLSVCACARCRTRDTLVRSDGGPGPVPREFATVEVNETHHRRIHRVEVNLIYVNLPRAEMGQTSTTSSSWMT